MLLFHLDQATKRGNKIRRTNVHFSGPNDEDEHQNLSSDHPQVIQQEDVSSEPPETLELLSVPDPLPRIIHIQHPEDLPSQTYLGKAVQGSTTDDY